MKCRKASADVVVGTPRTDLPKSLHDSQPLFQQPEDMAAASIPRCEIFAHPYKTLRLERLCPSCEGRRDVLLTDEAGRSSVAVLRWDDLRQWRIQNEVVDTNTRPLTLAEEGMLVSARKSASHVRMCSDSVLSIAVCCNMLMMYGACLMRYDGHDYRWYEAW